MTKQSSKNPFASGKLDAQKELGEPKKRTLDKVPAKSSTPKADKVNVVNFGDYDTAPNHVRLDEHVGETIYIIGIVRQQSEKFGDGYKITFKDIPTARNEYTAAVYGQYPAQQLDKLFAATNDGRDITPSSPIRTRLEEAGRSYRFA